MNARGVGNDRPGRLGATPVSVSQLYSECESRGSAPLWMGVGSLGGAHAISPGQQLVHGREVEVRSAELHDQMGDAVAQVLVAERGTARFAEQDRPFDRCRVASDLAAPVIERS